MTKAVLTEKPLLFKAPTSKFLTSKELVFKRPEDKIKTKKTDHKGRTV